MNRKQLLMTFATITMLTTLIVPIFLIQIAQANPSSWYMTVNGVLHSDYYTLYPYTDKSLKIGFSKFGELINSDDNVGLEYGEVDPFAPAAGPVATPQVPKHMWVQGWLINITYNHRTFGKRNVWATAIHSDSIMYGNDWIRVDFPGDYSTTYQYEDPRDPGYLIYGSGTYGTTLEYGGRKTNGTAVTEDIEVLYDGPRKFVAICRTTIYDHTVFLSNSTVGDIALVEIAITIEFNKVKKEVNLLKDVKSVLAWKEGEKMKIEFSNRGEVDLGTDTTGYGSYAHFFTEGTSTSTPPDAMVEGEDTVYNADWTLVRTEDPENTQYPGFSAAGPYPQTTLPATFDVAQAINPSAGYVWLAGFWPSLSDWSIDGWEQWWRSLKANDPHYIDYRIPAEEPFIPFYIGEWDFILWHSADSQMRTQFRGVTTYGLTDYHDAGDINMGSNENRLDREVQYQLDEKFQPFDLSDAVHKTTKRWVEFKPDGPTSFTLTAATPVVVVPDEEWDQYCEFSERVIRLDTGELLHRRSNDPAAGGTKDYNIILNPDGTATLTGLPPAKCKILYSTREIKGVTNGLIQLGLCLDGSSSLTPGNWTVIKNGVANAIINSLPHDGSVELTVVQFGFYDFYSQIEVTPTVIDSDATANAIAAAVLLMDQGYDNTPMAHGLNLTWAAMKNSPNFVSSEMQIINVATDGKPNVQLPSEPTGSAADDVTFVRDMAYLEGLDEIDAEAIGGDPVLTWMRDGLVLPQSGTIAPPYDPGWVEAVPDAAAFAAAMATKFDIIIPWRGRYEWVIVGRDSWTVDSAGAVLVAAAVKQKNTDIGLSGADMHATLLAAQMPYIMSKLGTGDTMHDYKDEIGRAALRDDWCKYWPVASSNIIGVGGPLANLLSYYANDFTDAIYGLTEYAGSAYSGKITGIPCWNRAWDGTWNVYSSFDTTTTGYAVISTYKDINGTVMFLVWGHFGRDTYYATQWLHGDVARRIEPGIHQLQDAPCGLTSIILQIKYTDPEHPTFSIPECLGTISECKWVHENEIKGGIHDP